MGQLHILVNGIERSIDVPPSTPLLSVLRDRLDLTGAKPGCGEGQCGACTVLVDGEAVRSCIFPARDVGNKPVITIEGLAHGQLLHPVQQAFLDASAFQCGFCTPGMILAAVALLKKRPHPDLLEIRRELAGNICRCGTYNRILTAVSLAAKEASHG